MPGAVPLTGGSVTRKRFVVPGSNSWEPISEVRSNSDAVQLAVRVLRGARLCLPLACVFRDMGRAEIGSAHILASDSIPLMKSGPGPT